MKRLRLVLIPGALAGAALLLFGAYLLVSTWGAERDTQSRTITLMTKPIPVLPPHEHRAEDATVDSVFDAGHGIIVESESFRVPEDLWITDIRIVSNVSDSILHHLILFRHGYPNLVCPERDQELYTAGADSLTHLSFPAPYGIFLKEGDYLYLHGMVHNPLFPRGEGQLYKDASIGYELTVVPAGARSKQLTFHRLFIADEAPCEPASRRRTDSFTVPPRSETFVRESDTHEGVNPSRFVFDTRGTIIGIGGHLHPMDGGQRVDAILNGKLLESFTPTLASAQPWDWVTGRRIVGVPVKRGDVLTLSVTYTNPFSTAIEDAMGQVAFFFAAK